MNISGRIAAAFQRTPITPLIALVLLLMGLFAALITPREEEPQINVTMANVLIPFPGASVQDVESMVSTPAERVLDQIAGVDHVFSLSRPGLAVMTVQFKVGVPRTEALVRLHDTLQDNQDWLPSNLGVLPPIVKPKGIDDVPIVALTLSSNQEEASPRDLERLARTLEIELKHVSGTREITTIGGPGQAVNVYLDAERMRAAGITVEQLSAALGQRNSALIAGNVVQNNQLLQIQTGTFLANAQEVAEVLVAAPNGKPIYVADVARVESGSPTPEKLVWHGEIKDGKLIEHPAITLQITKKPGENAVSVAENILARVEQLKGRVIPDDVHLHVSRNYGATAAEKANKLIQKLMFATVSVVALVWLALGRREAAIVGGAVVLTLTATLFASWAWGFTLNRVSLFALIFSIGILVDDAIVVVENIHRHRLLHPGKTLWEIIPGAVDEVGGPTILATFTVIAALLPMAFVSGLMGPYMSPIPINASLGMLLSLAIAFIVTPWLSNKWLPAENPHHDHAQTGFASKLPALFTRLLSPFLHPISGGRARVLLGFGIVGLIALSVSLAAVQWVVLKMLPFDNKSEFQVVLDMPVGTPVEETAAVLREMGLELAKHSDITDMQVYAGTAAPINFNGLVRQYYLRAAPELGDIQVNLKDKHSRHDKSHPIAQSVRPALQKIAQRVGGRVKVVEVPPGPPVLAPIVAEIYGPDAAGRRKVAQEVQVAFKNTPDIVDIDNTDVISGPRFNLKVKTSKAAALGISQNAITQTVYAALSGTSATFLHDGHFDPVPVRLVLPPETQGNLENVLRLGVRSANGALVPLGELVEVEDARTDIPRFHKDLLPVTYVVGDMSGKLDSPLYGLFAIRAKTNAIIAPDGAKIDEYFIHQPDSSYLGYALKWDGEWQVTYETFRDMGAAYAVGLILIYLLVVAQFKSYVTPLVIMAPIPLTIIGVMPGHALLGANFTATSMIGMIALAGIIVRNSILLVDFINLQISQGEDLAKAVIHATAVRAQPIVLTGLAAMLGAFFILDDPIFNGLAISLIFGILVSTMLTLVVIPVLHFAVERRRLSAKP
jgi:multidrug efflux pump subunit AcrB